MPEVPFSRRRAIAYALALLTAAVVAGRFVLPAGGAEERPGAALRIDARGSADAGAGRSAGGAAGGPVVVVHVVGAVRRPGLYRLREGARVADAVARAGGETGNADLALVNLAAPLADGLQVVVPARRAAAAGGDGGAIGDGVVHLNSATIEQLDALPGVGPVTAQKIVEYRDKHGAFRSVDDLDAVPGIGATRLEQLRELVAP